MESVPVYFTTGLCICWCMHFLSDTASGSGRFCRVMVETGVATPVLPDAIAKEARPQRAAAWGVDQC